MKINWLFLIITCLFLTSCNRLKLAFNFIDTAIESQIDNFFDLDRRQSMVFSREVDRYVKQLRSQHVQTIATRLGASAKLVEKNELSGGDIAQISDEFRQELYNSISPFRNMITQLASGLKGKQLKVFEKAIAQRKQKIEKRLVEEKEQKEKELGTWRSRRFRENFEDWTGSLSDQQETWILEFYQENRFPRELQIKNLEHMSQGFLQAQKQGKKGLNKYFTDFLNNRTFEPEYQKAQRQFFAKWTELMDRLLKSLSATQRKTLASRLQSWSNDLQDLASK